MPNSNLPLPGSVHRHMLFWRASSGSWDVTRWAFMPVFWGWQRHLPWREDGRTPSMQKSSRGPCLCSTACPVLTGFQRVSQSIPHAGWASKVWEGEQAMASAPAVRVGSSSASPPSPRRWIRELSARDRHSSRGAVQGQWKCL